MNAITSDLVSVKAELAKGIPLKLEDCAEMQSIISAMTGHVDHKEFSQVVPYFADGAIMDYSSVYGPEFKCVPAKEFFIGIEKSLEGFDASHHQITNFYIRGQGDSAVCRSNCFGNSVKGQDIWNAGSFYHHKFVKQNGAWKVVFWSCELVFERGPRFWEK